jgi:hypothetical protein
MEIKDPNEFQKHVLALIDHHVHQNFEHEHSLAAQVTAPHSFAWEYLTLKIGGSRRSGHSALLKFVGEKYPDKKIAALCPQYSGAKFIEKYGFPPNVQLFHDPLRMRGVDWDLIFCMVEGDSTFIDKFLPSIFQLPARRYFIIG